MTGNHGYKDIDLAVYYPTNSTGIKRRRQA